MAKPAGDEWTPQEAYCAFATLAIEIDGSVGREEHEALMGYLKKSEVLAEHSSDLDGLIKSVHRRVKLLGEHGALYAAGEALPEHLKEKAFRAAVDLTWSDDDSDATEETFIFEAATALNIDAARRDALIKAVAPE